MRKSVGMTFFLFCLGILTGPAASAEPSVQVVVSIKPIHSLVAGVMEGVGEPLLLVKGGGSPHGYSLRPSEARALERAQLIIWVGPDLESFLEKPLSTLGKRARKLRLSDALKAHLLSVREGGAWESHEETGHEHGHHSHGENHDQKGVDPHIWLDPARAKRIVDESVAALVEVDPAHRSHYLENGARLKERLDALDRELRGRLEPVKEIPYIVFHDAYQYFEAAYGLRAVGSISVDPERPTGAGRIRQIRQKIEDTGARAVFSEPQFEPRLVRTVVEGTGAGTGVLDPLGADLPEGPEAYFALMRRLADGLVEGLRSGR